MSNEAAKLACSRFFLGHLRLCLTQAKDIKKAKSAECISTGNIFIDGTFAKGTFI